MKVVEIPFNKLVEIREADDESHILMLEDSDKYLNHLGTVHASAQFALAEATSGEYLLRRFAGLSADIAPVVRRVDIKYSKPAAGVIYSKAHMEDADYHRVITELNTKGRTMLQVNVQIQDKSGNITMRSTFEWFIQRINQVP